MLLAIAGFTLLAFLPGEKGHLLERYLGFLRWVFGWGTYLTPLLVGAVGLWLVLREFGDRLPKLTPLQALGILLGYPALLATLHILAAILRAGWGLRTVLWEVADEGNGGGILGAALSGTLLKGLGIPGTLVALITWWLTVAVLAFGVTVQDVVTVYQSLRSRRRRAKPLPKPITPPAQPAATPAQRGAGQPGPTPAPSTSIPVKSQLTGQGDQPSAPTPPLLIGAEKIVWQTPALDDILEPGNGQDFSADILRRQAKLIEETLTSLNAPVRVQEINRGPVVTQFGLEPLVIKNASGKETKVKVSRIAALADDLALALEARTLRVEAPIPGKGLVGIEVPNPEISLVALRDVMESNQYAQVDSPLRVCLGQDVSGNPMVTDLTTMPHLLIAGTTGSGKSVCINAIIAALLINHTPDFLKFLMVDPKRVELTGYDGIPHLLSKVVVEMERVTGALQWVLREMDSRYQRFSKSQATNILDYNRRIALQKEDAKPLPYIMVVIDELADLMMMAPQETERSLCRIAQMARATGIHLIIATQRPSVDVVTGLIKANFPARIAFNVASTVDSRVILDQPGAEQLLGRGDMLFLPPDAPTPMRLQGAFVSDEELRRLVQFWKAQARPGAVPVEKTIQKPLWEEKKPKIEYEDELLPDVVDVVLKENRASISLLQRKLRIGYTRAARIMDILERHDVVGPQPSGGKAREVFPSAARAMLNPQGDEK